MMRLVQAGWLVLGLGLIAVGPASVGHAETPSQPFDRPVRVAVYDDFGSGSQALGDLLKVLAERDQWTVGRLKASEIRAGALDDYDLVIFPGGMSSTQGRTLGSDGRERVRAFVRHGGGYIGFCAGAYLASCDPDYDWSLNILNANVLDKEHWARGVGPVEIQVSETGQTVLGVTGDRLTIHYHQGPLLCAAGRDDLPPYQPWAGFETEIAKNGAPSGVMPGTTAIAASLFGAGRVLCFSPHPEMTDGLHEIVHRGIEWTAKRPLPVEIVGHRGASHDAPENTLASIRAAWSQGADAAEFDVYISRDGHPVVIHDKTTERVAGVKHSVEKSTLAELQSLDVGRWKNERFAGERIPTLAQVLATVPTGKSAFVEIKCGPEGVPAILTTIAASGLAPDQVRLISFSADVVAACKQARPDLAASWIVSLKRNDPAHRPTALIAAAQEIQADGLDLSAVAWLDADFAAELAAAGLRLDVWTVNDRDVAVRMCDLGVAGITTDRPEWLREQLATQATQAKSEKTFQPSSGEPPTADATSITSE